MISGNINEDKIKPMTLNMKSISVITVGAMWFLVGAFLITRGIGWIHELGLTTKLIIFTSIAVTVGLLKGKFVLQKVALKYLKRSDTIEYNKIDILTGWLKILGIKGSLLIALMIAMGVVLRHSNINRPILGVIYMAVGIALLYSSKMFFKGR